ncbi:MAG: hypothetical protein EA397_11890 [Deltaproteobacteria bacterium]|nr:MAG: hypothetical protein EA397_11890 [Deltaproteobacteria bacterium]
MKYPKLVPSLVGSGLFVGSLAGFLIPQGLTPGASGPSEAQRTQACEKDVQIRAQSLVEVKEEVLEVRAHWNQIELQLAPIGGVPSWWSSKDTLEGQQARAKARSESLPGGLLEASCEEDPCMLLFSLKDEEELDLPHGEHLFRHEDRAVLALAPAAGATPKRLARMQVRATRLLRGQAAAGELEEKP